MTDPRTAFIVALVAVSVVAATVVATVAITNNTKRGLATAATLGQVQQERERNIRTSCQDINQRHDNTLKQLDVLLAQARETATPKEIQEIEKQRAGTILLLNAIIPKRDCESLVRQSIGTGGTPR